MQGQKTGMSEEGEEKFRTKGKVRQKMRKDTESGRKIRARVDMDGGTVSYTREFKLLLVKEHKNVHICFCERARWLQIYMRTNPGLICNASM